MTKSFSKTLRWCLASAALSSVIAAPVSAAGTSMDPTQLRVDMRKLWEDHITWTRQWIVSFAANLPDQDAAAGRLMQNQTDIGTRSNRFTARKPAPN